MSTTTGIQYVLLLLWYKYNAIYGLLHLVSNLFFQYIMLWELGLAVLVRGIWTRSPVVAVGSLASSHHWSFSSSVNSSQAGRPYCGHRNPPDRGAEAFHLTPSHSSSLPSSFDYRRAPILPAVQSFWYISWNKFEDPTPAGSVWFSGSL